MAFQYLTETNIYDCYKDSKGFTDSLTTSFPELERIARNKPHPSVPKQMPKVTDGTTAAIIRKTPRRIIQQIPTGTVHGDGPQWLIILAEFIFTHEIIPHANQDYALIQKCWAMVEKGLTYGSCPIYVPFLNHGGYFCPDMTLPHWGDVFVQPGKKSDTDSNYIFVRSWWRTEDIDALIDKEKTLTDSAKKRKEKYEGTWDVAALESVKKQVQEKEDTAKTANEKEKSPSPTSGVELVTGFPRGLKGTFLTFHYTSKQIVRRKKNNDPLGEIPVPFFYADIDGSNPMGRGVVELVGPLQNLMDSEMQMYQYNRALMLNPPIIKRGTYPKRNIKFIPNAIIDVGSVPTNDAKPMDISTTAIQTFNQNYGLMKSQALNLLSSPDTSISADVGNPGFSKTPAGVNTQNANVSVDDNQVRKMFETVFGRWAQLAINMWFSEKKGIEELQLDQETADKLRKLEAEGKLEPGFVTDDNRVRVDYDSATPALKFTVDASTSEMKDAQKQLQGLEILTTTLDSSPQIAALVPPEKILGIWNSIVASSGVENPEDLKVDIEEFKKKQQEAAQAQPAVGPDGQPLPAPDGQITPGGQTSPAAAGPPNPMAGAGVSTAPASAPVQTPEPPQSQGAPMSSPVPPALQDPNQPTNMTPEVTPNHPDDHKFIAMLHSMGVGKDKINQALIMLHAGKNTGSIMNMLKG